MLKLGYKLGHHAGIMLDALTMPLYAKLCRYNVSNPNEIGEMAGCLKISSRTRLQTTSILTENDGV